MPDLNALIHSLKASQEKVERERQAFMKNVGKQMADEVKMNTPVDTGNLRDSIHYEISGDTISITTDVVYAPYVDKGHATKGGTFVPGRHMFDKAMLKANAVVDPEAKRFLSKINLLG